MLNSDILRSNFVLILNEPKNNKTGKILWIEMKTFTKFCEILLNFLSLWIEIRLNSKRES